MGTFEVQTEDGKTEKVMIPGSEDLSPQHIDELLHWSRENAEKRAVETEQKKRDKKIPAGEAYREIAKYRQWRDEGKGKVF